MLKEAIQGALYSFGEEIQTNSFDIHNIDEVQAQS